MQKLLLLILLATSVAACPTQLQYVDPGTVIRLLRSTKGDNVRSEGLTDCTDKPRVEHFVKTQGPAGDCRLSTMPFQVPGGSMKIGKSLVCPFKQPDGTTQWSVVNEKYAFPNFK